MIPFKTSYDKMLDYSTGHAKCKILLLLNANIALRDFVLDNYTIIMNMLCNAMKCVIGILNENCSGFL